MSVLLDGTFCHVAENNGQQIESDKEFYKSQKAKWDSNMCHQPINIW